MAVAARLILCVKPLFELNAVKYFCCIKAKWYNFAPQAVRIVAYACNCIWPRRSHDPNKSHYHTQQSGLPLMGYSSDVAITHWLHTCWSLLSALKFTFQTDTSSIATHRAANPNRTTKKNTSELLSLEINLTCALWQTLTIPKCNRYYILYNRTIIFYISHTL